MMLNCCGHRSAASVERHTQGLQADAISHTPNSPVRLISPLQNTESSGKLSYQVMYRSGQANARRHGESTTLMSHRAIALIRQLRLTSMLSSHPSLLSCTSMRGTAGSTRRRGFPRDPASLRIACRTLQERQVFQTTPRSWFRPWSSPKRPSSSKRNPTKPPRMRSRQIFPHSLPRPRSSPRQR